MKTKFLKGRLKDFEISNKEYGIGYALVWENGAGQGGGISYGDCYGDGRGGGDGYGGRTGFSGFKIEIQNNKLGWLARGVEVEDCGYFEGPVRRFFKFWSRRP